MSNTLKPNEFGEKLYNSLPPLYHVADEDVEYALKRYLSALADGGYAKVIEEINGFLTLVDPDKINEELLPILFQHYGFEAFNGIPTLYLRKLLPLVSDIYNLKGTITAVEYLTSVVAGVKPTVGLDKEFSENHTINVKLEMDYLDHQNDMPDKDQLLRIIGEFVPFYCDLVLVYYYVYSDKNAIIFREFNIDHITDTKTERRNISSTEVIKDKIGTVVKDSINILTTMGSARFNDQTAKFNDFLLGIVPFEQTVKVAYTDSESMTFIESAESVISTMSEQNATFGHAVMTIARFNDKSFDKTTVSY